MSDNAEQQYLEQVAELLARYVGQAGYEVFKVVQYDLDQPAEDYPDVTKWWVICRAPTKFEELHVALQSFGIAASLQTAWGLIASGNLPALRESKSGEQRLVFDYWINREKTRARKPTKYTPDERAS